MSCQQLRPCGLIVWGCLASDSPTVDEGGEVLFRDAQLAAEPVHAQFALLDPAADGLDRHAQCLGHLGNSQEAGVTFGEGSHGGTDQ